MQTSLRQSLILLSFLGVTVATIIVVVSLWLSFSSMIKSHVDKEVVLVEKLLNNVLAEKESRTERNIASSLNAINSDAVLDNKDIEKLSHAFLGSLSQSIEGSANASESYVSSSYVSSSYVSSSDARSLDLALINLDHTVISSTSNSYEKGAQSLRSVAMAAMGLNHVLSVENGVLTHLSLKSVVLNNERYYVLMARDIQREVLETVSALSEADISIIDRTTQVLLASTLSTRLAEEYHPSIAGFNWQDVTFSEAVSYIEYNIPVSTLNTSPAKITVLIDVANYVQSFREMQNMLFSLYLLALLIISLFFMVWTKRITSPLNSVITVIDSVSSGRYKNKLNSTSRFREINELESAIGQMQSKIFRREERIKYQAQHDDLTGLYNRNFLEEFFVTQMRDGKSIQVIAITVIGFRTINDLYGYSNGDNTLKSLAWRLLQWPGTSARLAGGEVIYITDEPLNELQLETLKYILEQPVESNLITIPVKVAMAVLECPEDASDTEELFRKLNIVSDNAIRSGAALTYYSEALEQGYNRRLLITTELKRVLATQQHELSVVYQPKIDLKTMKVCSMEVLLRWNNSRLGQVSPDEFISVAEQAGLIEQVTKWVMKTTITDLAYFRSKRYDFSVAMNLSSHDIQNKTLLNELVALLTEKGLSPASLQLEITESDLVADASLAVENLSSLKSLGFRFAIDDFGTGYSSLAYLKNLPVETIKIDKSFILNLSTDENDQQIVHTILSLAGIFELNVVAEGVEDAESLNILKEWGCDVAQGYYISRPLKREDLEAWLLTTPYHE